ncbi:general stress protein [Paenibacillus eucommiae]|uniref:General stress protein 17M-like domain-containing protein n=1 Tax=Paenibacillus eucommiae TaxID=1355755 RepID=A0ABS4INL8_9BACL|nr:general stress protein [Paenibacillus eucommiae]MBP1989105.1 hypothetical protein [Paenibacillus eucommiae]
MSEYTTVHTVNNILETRKKIEDLQREGYLKENIFVLTHDKERTEHIVDHTDGNQIGVADEGVLTAVANIFRSRGDELRAKMQAMGVSREYAEHLEGELDKGKIVILAWGGTTYEGDKYDQNITYYPPFNRTTIL